jgi:hypothetical protein
MFDIIVYKLNKMVYKLYIKEYIVNMVYTLKCSYFIIKFKNNMLNK